MELIPVTKTVEVAKIEEVIEYGINIIGENRVQELEKKMDVLGPGIDYHMIGHLQSNKVKYIADKVKLIHSLDRESLIKEIEKQGRKNNTVMDVLVQVNVAEEKSKHGLKTEQVVPFIEKVLSYDYINIKGLMTIAPHVDDEKYLRKIFRTMYELKEDILRRNYNGLSMDYLSMGMTNDYKIAIEEGSNMVRIGRGIFGERNY